MRAVETVQAGSRMLKVWYVRVCGPCRPADEYGRKKKRTPAEPDVCDPSALRDSAPSHL